MQRDWLARTEIVLGKEGLLRLNGSRVAVFGLGGVGGYVAEALARSGVGALDLIDADRVEITNVNRQLYATRKTIGMYKTEVAAARIADISPECKVRTHNIFFLPETADGIDFGEYDYVADAIDTVAGKLALVERAAASGTPIISAMGAGNRLDPAALEVSDIGKTSVCPLARVMRRELRKRGIDRLKVVYSREERPLFRGETAPGDVVTGSTAFVPAAMGLIMAAEIVKELAGGGGRTAGKGERQ